VPAQAPRLSSGEVSALPSRKLAGETGPAASRRQCWVPAKACGSRARLLTSFPFSFSATGTQQARPPQAPPSGLAASSPRPSVLHFLKGHLRTCCCPPLVTAGLLLRAPPPHPQEPPLLSDCRVPSRTAFCLLPQSRTLLASQTPPAPGWPPPHPCWGPCQPLTEAAGGALAGWSVRS